MSHAGQHYVRENIKWHITQKSTYSAISVASIKMGNEFALHLSSVYIHVTFAI